MERQGGDLAVASEQGSCVSDRRLLELAAEAAGYMPNQNWIWLTDRCCFTYRAAGKHVFWNPVTDDGDALRLATKLRLDICRPSAAHDVVCVWVDHMGDFVEELHGSDPCAATRRAIVRAAAEIGRTLENAGAQPNAPIK